MPIAKSQTLPPILPAIRTDSGEDTHSPLPPREPHRPPPVHTSTLPTQTAPSTPTGKSYIPPRPSPLARASTLLQSHLPPNLQNLHFELPPALANFDPLAFLTRFATHVEEEGEPIVPEIVAEGYEPLGEWKDIFGFHCYVVGPDPSIDCLVCAFDIFGFSLPILQGADILFKLTGSTVYIPDLFHGSPYPSTAFPPKTPEQTKQLQDFFATRANIDDRRDDLVQFGHDLRDRFSGQPWADSTKIALYGVSWGAKLAFLSGSQTLPFYSIVALTPAMLTLPDAEALKIPVGLFPSKDEPADQVQQMVDAFRMKTFSARCVCRPFATMPHTFLTALSNLPDPLVRKAFEEAYVATAKFLRAAKAFSAVAGGATAPGSPTALTGGGGGEQKVVDGETVGGERSEKVLLGPAEEARKPEEVEEQEKESRARQKGRGKGKGGGGGGGGGLFGFGKKKEKEKKKGVGAV